MTEQEAITQATEKYRQEGYAVAANPDPASLPAELRNRRPALLATKNGASVVVEVWSRDRINDLPPAFLPPGWQFDVVTLPSTPADAPGPGPDATPEFTNRLLAELEDFVPRGAFRARFLLAWSAVEAAMRVAAQRSGINPQPLAPRQLMSELVSAGLLSHDRLARLQERFATRNRLIHGVPVDVTDPGEVDEMVALARELLGERLAAAS
jgi:REase_AHJR-like